MIDEPNFEVTDLRTGLPNGRATERGTHERGHRRTLGAAILALALLGALALPFVRVPGLGATLSQALRLPTPIPTPTPPLGANVVYFQHGLPWGALRMDGQPVTNVDTEQGYTGKELRYTSLRLPPGRHQLTYAAAPFPALRCWISAPAARSDTCPLATGQARDVQPPFPTERVLSLGGDPANLAPSQQAALEAAAARYIATLATSSAIEPGDAYADATGAPQVASGRMTATLSYTLNTDSQQFYDMRGVSPRGCAILCAYQPASYINDTTAQWDIAAHIVPTWTYTRDDGASVSGSATPQRASQGSFAPIAVTWDGAWHVRAADVQQGTPGCLVALTAVASLNLSGAPPSSLTMVSAPIPAEGCLIIGNAPNASGTTSVTFTLMYRFGLLFAVDDEARSLLPGIPRADASLQRLAHTWAS
jgi:hypothetical protein